MEVRLNNSGFSYDVHSLCKAFFPEEDVVISDESNPLIEEPAPDIVIVFEESTPLGSNYESGKITIKYYGEYKQDERTRVQFYENCDRHEVKSILKRMLYELLSTITEKKLPWGTLTGIRPTKIPMKMINEGVGDEEIAKYMQETYYTSDEKVTLATEIAHREKLLIDRLNSRDGYSLYVGIPFCPTRCMYCSFTSYPISKYSDRVDKYLEALKRELDLIAENYEGRQLDTVYIGGGTPTTLSAASLAELIGYIKERFDFSDVKEFTVEAGRPDSVSPDKLKVLKENGVTRISINPQTMNQETLCIIGRNHTVEDVHTAFEMAREAGFDNINMDLILGLPGETEADVAYTLKEVSKLKPDSLTVHSMAIKRAANMHRFLAEHEEIRSYNSPEMMRIARETAESMGLDAYYLYRQKNMAGNFENVGYAREGKYGIYNILIMEEIQDIAAAGAGTISKRVFDANRIERCDDVKDVDLYIKEIDSILEKKKQFFAL